MSRVLTREHVIRGGCQFFVRHGTVDMAALAASLAISRATLYRIVHSRDALLGEVLWLLGDHLLTQARRRGGDAGIDGVLEVTRLFTAWLRAATPFQVFLRAEPETAARVLLTTSGHVHRHVVRAQREILLEKACAQWLPAAPEQQAYLYVCLAESALYGELLGGVRLDLALIERAARGLLT